MRAAEIAARKFGSSDPAIDRSDFVSIAAVRILERKPSNMATAVHVGREAIGKIIKQARYKKEGQTVRGSATELVTNRLTLCRPAQSIAEKKKLRFTRDLLRRIGLPEFYFSRFGIAYLQSRWPVQSGVWFDSMDSVNSRRRRRLLLRGAMTADVESLADQHYVCLLIPDDYEQSQTKNRSASLAEGQPVESVVQTPGGPHQAR